MVRSHTRACILSLFCLVLVGCSSNMGDIHGQLTSKGERVTAGSIIFFPQAGEEQFEAGKAAATIPDEGGSFRLSAIVGTHHVRYVPAPPPQTTDKDLHAKMLATWQEFGHLRLEEGYTIDVKPGRNDITLELTAGPRRPPVVDD
jgi:hypothetical protein